MAQVITTMIIQLMNGVLSFEDTSVSSTTVGELREELGLTNRVSVNDVIAADDDTIRGREYDDEGNVTYAGDRVAHVAENKRGGK